ncbi:glycosyltransferase family 2 protein [Agromyces sp. NPDC058484]|uniref:glycosyltransferase family 2 protein n=1 Tax=Agromyces sp. NPDC058484 TaxID=3346524 RepID=UPI003666B80B
MNLGLVVSTLGRAEPLERLLRSLSRQVHPDDRLVLVAQDHLAEVEALAGRFRGDGFAIDVTTSPRGASRGRNAGVAALPPGERLLHFPNDTTWFPDGCLDAIRSAASGLEAGALTVVDEHGPKFSLPGHGAPLDRWNVWNVIEMGLLIRRSVFDELGGFDPGLGTGAPTPWQAGEATDLLLRLVERRPDLARAFDWLPPAVSVGGIADPSGLSPAERRRKLRAYGRGLGRLVMRHPYPWWWRFAFVFGGLAFGLRHRSTNTVADGWWVFLGRGEGALGRTVGGRATAVTR